MSDQKIYDTIIVGAGAAGLTAAIYSSRRAMKTLLVTQDIGGQAATTNEIENYPGVGLVTGPNLMNEFKQQAQQFGAKFALAEVTGIIKRLDDRGTPVFTVSTNTGQYITNSVILAYGLTHRHLDVPGEQEFGGKGVSYCATCDAPLFKGKPVAVVGGGNSGVDAALLLSKICPKVYLIHRRDQFNAEAVLVEQLKQPNIELVLNSEVQEIRGDSRLRSLVVREVGDATKTRELQVEGLFVEVGYVVNSKLIEGLVELDQRKQIKISFDGETSQPGIFAAGDITIISFKQIVISAGWGATAALKAYEYLQKVKGFRGVKIDWGLAQKPNPTTPLA
ncbi:MAG: FAD-dependent oxidoreductase [Candidatus Kerfeldbacteria bacterium]|nr:FAD-dependent oxidoreductase [Candidatus Kerfeldbacteria bacterium]